MSDHHFVARSRRYSHQSCHRVGPGGAPAGTDEVEIFVPPTSPDPLVVEGLEQASILIGAVAGTWPDEMVILVLGQGRQVAAVVAFGSVGPQRICSDPRPLFALLEALDAVEVVVGFVGRSAMTPGQRRAQAARLDSVIDDSPGVACWDWLDLTDS